MNLKNEKMGYSEERKKYAREWYHKNKERINSLPHRKAAKKLSMKKWYEKNRKKVLEKSRHGRHKDIEAYRKERRKNYHKNRERILALRKRPDKQEKTKRYMKLYRQKNKEKIYAQDKERNRGWMKKQIDKVSDAYIISRLCNKKVGIFKTYAEARKHPEIIEQFRTKILLSRVKAKINKHDKAESTRANKRYKNIGQRG